MYLYPNANVTHSSAPTTTAVTSTKPVLTPVEQCQHGIKLDSTLYTVLKDDRQWDNWQSTTMATTCAQNIENVFESGRIYNHDARFRVPPKRPALRIDRYYPGD